MLRSSRRERVPELCWTGALLNKPKADCAPPSPAERDGARRVSLRSMVEHGGRVAALAAVLGTRLVSAVSRGRESGGSRVEGQERDRGKGA